MVAVISLLGILLALTLIVLGVMRGLSLIFLVPLSVVVVALTGGLDLIAAYGEHYMKGFGGFLTGFFPLFLAGAIFGKLMDDSGVTEAIARDILRWLGVRHVVSALFAATFVLTIGGVSAFVIIFTMYPMASGFYRQANLPKKLIPANILGPVVAAQMTPGTPELQNILPTKMMGVTPYAGPIMGFTALVLVTVLSLLYLNRVARKMQQVGDGWRAEDAAGEWSGEAGRKLPRSWTVVFPVGLSIVLLNGFDWPAYAALVAGAVLMVAMYFNYYPKLWETLNAGAKNSQVAIVTASIVGLGGVVKMAPGFSLVTDFLASISLGNPLLYAMIAVNTLAAVTGSASGGMTLTVDTLGQILQNMGGSPEGIARIIAISSLGLDSLPHNSAIVLTLSFCGVSHREGYRYLFVTTCVLSLIAGIVGVLLGSIGLV